jgi:2-oxoglutarate/2-oxoacid ferredoxin oxidoreductase subunit beta
VKEIMDREKVVSAKPDLWTGVGAGVHACAGCQQPTFLRVVMEALTEMDLAGRAVMVVGIGCTPLIGFAGMNIDRLHGPHGRSPDMATGVKRVCPESLVFTMQGDGDLAAIGAGSLIGALNRGEKITIFMINNANFGNTGGQMAPTTLPGQVTTTTPYGRTAQSDGYPMHVAEFMASFKSVVYSARGSLVNPAQYQRTKKFVKTAFQKQVDGSGVSFVECLAACPVNWHLTPMQSLKWIEEKMMVEYPVGEFKNIDKIE